MADSARLSRRARAKLKIASRLIDEGIGIIALKRRSKQPDPRFCPNGSHNATTDPGEIRAWLDTDDRINLAGVLLGTPFLVIDVDGPEGERAAKALGPLPRTLMTKTPNGSHRFYRHEGKVAGSRIKLSADLDVIASGYVLLPESDHPDGGGYESADWTQRIASLPRETIAAINKKGAGERAVSDEPDGEAIGKGRRDNSLTSIGGALRRQGYGLPLIITALSAIDEGHCDPPLGAKAVRKIAKSIARYDPADADLFADMSDVEPRKVEFSWYPYLVRGAVNLLEGDPGTGKTYLLCTIAACFSAGIPLPGQADPRPVNVLFMSAEDDPDTTLAPRLTRMGADLSRITYTTRYLRLEEEALGWIDKHIEEKGIELVILDPLLAYMQGGIDMNKANETRPFMARLGELAKRRNVTIVCLRHLTKHNAGKAIYRGLGSIDITAAARSAIMVGVHPMEPDMRVMMHIKHNLSKRGASLGYELPVSEYAQGRVPKLKWLGEVDIHPDDLEAKPGQPGRPDDTRQQAAAFLKQALADGIKPIKQVLSEGERRSFSARTLRRAAKAIGVEKEGKSWKLAKTPV